MGALKMTDMKLTDQLAGHEIARHDKYSLLLFLPIPVILAVLWKI